MNTIFMESIQNFWSQKKSETNLCRNAAAKNVAIHYIFGSESLRVEKSLQIVDSLRILFFVCRGPLGAHTSRYIDGVLQAQVLKQRKPSPLQPLPHPSPTARQPLSKPPFQPPLGQILTVP